MGATAALFLVLGAFRYQTALPHFDEGDLAYYNGRGQAKGRRAVVAALLYESALLPSRSRPAAALAMHLMPALRPQFLA